MNADGEPTGKGNDTAPAEADQPPVCLAFQLGWDMSRLYAVASVRRDYRYAPGAKLPSQRDFGGALNTERRMAAVSAGLTRVAAVVDEAGLDQPSVAGVRAAYDASRTPLRRAGQKKKPSKQEVSKARAAREKIQEAVYRLHVTTLVALQAADPKIGSAYNLGRALAEAALESDLKQLKRRFGYHRVSGLRQELVQLASSFPPHAARAVSQSLCIWQCVMTPRLQGGKGSQSPEQALPRQAEQWRSVLSGERLGVDRLGPDDYVGAGRRLVNNASRIVRGVLSSYWRGLLLAVALFAGGIALAIQVDTTGAVIAGVGTAASALGISLRGIGSTLGDVGRTLRGPLWEAELDLAVAHAITVREAWRAYEALPSPQRKCDVAVTIPRRTIRARSMSRLRRGAARLRGLLRR
jgi:hypothetical protein